MKNFFKNLTLGKIMDFLIFNFCLFLITFSWARFVSHMAFVGVIFATFTTIIVNFFRIIISKRNTQKTKLSNEKKIKIENCMLELLSSTKKENFELISSILSPTKQVFDGNCFFLASKNNAFGFDFDSKEMKLENALKLCKLAIKSGATKLTLLCLTFSIKDKNTLMSIENLKIEIFEKEQVYNTIFEKGNVEVKSEICFKTQKKYKFKQLLQISLQREKAKKYFFSGLLIFACSLIVRYNFYYLFMSSTLFFLSILSLKNKNSATNDAIF